MLLLFGIESKTRLQTILGILFFSVALLKESSLHPPSKLFYRCPATTDLLIDLVTQRVHATYWMSVVYGHWRRYQATLYAGYLC